MENFAVRVETEKECIKVVATQIAQGQAQYIGAAKQNINDIDRVMRELKHSAGQHPADAKSRCFQGLIQA